MINSYISPAIRSGWQVPTFKTLLWQGKQHSWCVVIPVINEGMRIQNLLVRMASLNVDSVADIIIVDGGSTDGSLELEWLQTKGVRGLLEKTGTGKLSAQLRCAYAYALDQGYEGIVSIDGNDKDDPEAIPRFIEALKQGVDFVQASRFLAGGVAENTPKSRDFAIRFIHAPMLSLFSGFKWTDTTQGFRAYSRKMLLDTKIALFRDVFLTYELLAYLSYRAPKLGYRCIELPTVRRYPKGEVPTKISAFKGNIAVLLVLFKACFGRYNPRELKHSGYKLIKLKTSSNNVVWHQASVTRERREKQNGHRSVLLFFTGLSGAGKSTIAHAVEEKLYQYACHTYVLDGDNVRHGLNKDLGFSDQDREENIRRIGEVAKLFLDAGVITLTAFISPFENDRKLVKDLVGTSNFLEIYCYCPLDVCEGRDVKGLYKKARLGLIVNFTGVSSPYEAPFTPALTLNTAELSVGECVDKVMELLLKQDVNLNFKK